jgi:hypothetical protein
MPNNSERFSFMSEEDSRRTHHGGVQEARQRGVPVKLAEGHRLHPQRHHPAQGTDIRILSADPHDMMFPKQSYNVLDIKRTGSAVQACRIVEHSITTASHDPIR